MASSITLRMRALTLAVSFVAETTRPMNDEGIPSPGTYKLGAKPTTYKLSLCNPPRCGSKRKRQWR